MKGSHYAQGKKPPIRLFTSLEVVRLPVAPVVTVISRNREVNRLRMVVWLQFVNEALHNGCSHSPGMALQPKLWMMSSCNQPMNGCFLTLFYPCDSFQNPLVYLNTRGVTAL